MATTTTAKTDINNANIFILAGDIGGTNSRLSIHHPNVPQAIYTQNYLNSDHLINLDHDTFENRIIGPFLQDFFSSSSIRISSDIIIIACLAVAGPVRNNRVEVTNIGNMKGCIVLDGNNLEQQNNDSDFGILRCIKACVIINDFVGQGYGLLDLDVENENKCIPLTPKSIELFRVNQVSSTPGPIACVGAGTGLGECYLTCSSLRPRDGYECNASEGGHADYVPHSNLERELLDNLREKFDEPNRVSVERVVSGRGLANVYEFLAKKFPDKVDSKVDEDFHNAGDMKGRVVGVQANMEEGQGCQLCCMALDIFASAYGSEVGNAALKFLPTGGMFVSGGLTGKNLKFIEGKDGSFMKAYFDKGRVKCVLDNVPLFAVLDEGIGLNGARIRAEREYKKLFSM